MAASADRTRRVGLFVTCLVDLMRPSVGFAAVKLLEDAGCRSRCRCRPAAASRPTTPATARRHARLAERVIEAFARFDYVVAPSGSCAGMIGALSRALRRGSELAPRRDALAAKTYELVDFLVDVLGVDRVAARFDGRRDLSRLLLGPARARRPAQPRRLLASVDGPEPGRDGRSATCAAASAAPSR